MIELKGKVIKLIDENNGVILGEDNHEYIFSRIDFLSNFSLNINDKLIFKPKVILINNFTLYKAVMISREANN